MKLKGPIICPKCGKLARSADTKYGLRNFCCNMWSWGKNYPLATKETHRLRKKAHVVFDKLWKEELVSRTKAYSILSKELNIEKEFCHIKLMEDNMLKMIISVIPKIHRKLLKEKKNMAVGRELIRVSDSYWILGGIAIKYSEDFGYNGWYIPEESDTRAFPKTYGTLEKALNRVMNQKTPKRKMPRPAGF